MSEQVPGWAIEATEPSALEISRLQARLRDPAPSRSWGLPAAAMAAAALVLVAILVMPGPAYGPAPSVGTPMALGQAPLLLGPSIRVTGTGSLIVEQAGETGTRVRLAQGTLVAAVDPDGPFRAFTVVADDVEVSVVGTRFSVSWSEGAGAVSVQRGRVAVQGRGERLTLGAGDGWNWGGDTTAGEEPLDHPVPGVDDGAPGLPGGGAHPPPPARAVEQPTVAPPTVLATPRPTPAPNVAPDPEPIAAVDPLPQPPEAEPAPDLARARAFGRVQEAMETEAYSDAATLADRFLDTWPGGALGAEAGALRIEALAHTDPRAAIAAADAWLDTYRSHTRRAEVLRIRAATANDALRDCGLALPSYLELSETQSGREQAQAMAFLGLCAHQTGDTATAQRAIDAALDHPDLPRPLAPSLRAARRALSSEAPR